MYRDPHNVRIGLRAIYDSAMMEDTAVVFFSIPIFHRTPPSENVIKSIRL